MEERREIGVEGEERRGRERKEGGKGRREGRGWKKGVRRKKEGGGGEEGRER